jgi:hypothetical protein
MDGTVLKKDAGAIMTIPQSARIIAVHGLHRVRVKQETAGIIKQMKPALLTQTAIGMLIAREIIFYPVGVTPMEPLVLQRIAHGMETAIRKAAGAIKPGKHAAAHLTVPQAMTAAGSQAAIARKQDAGII